MVGLFKLGGFDEELVDLLMIKVVMAENFNFDWLDGVWNHGTTEPLLEPWMMIYYIVNMIY